jgi:2-methylaconitate cis-trans-isomerase PrpF
MFCMMESAILYAGSGGKTDTPVSGKSAGRVLCTFRQVMMASCHNRLARIGIAVVFTTTGAALNTIVADFIEASRRAATLDHLSEQFEVALQLPCMHA